MGSQWKSVMARVINDREKFSELLESVGPFNIIMAIEDLGDDLIEGVFGEINFKEGYPQIKEEAFIKNFNISQDSMLFGDDTSPNMLLFYEKSWERKLYLEFTRVWTPNINKMGLRVLSPHVRCTLPS